jgi:hypothetical protein
MRKNFRSLRDLVLLLNTYTFAGWVTGSLYHNVTGIFSYLWHITSVICVQRRHECRTSQGSLSCSPWKSVCHDWSATNATQNCIPECEDILAVTSSWLISVCGFCVCGIWSWKSHVWWFLGMKEFLNPLQRCWVGNAGPIPLPGRSCDFTLLDIFWSNVTEHVYIQPFGLLLTERHTEIEHVLRPAIFWDCMQH